MRWSRWVTAGVLVLVTAAASGCGGDDQPTPSAQPSSSPSATLTGPGLDPEENFAVGDDFAEALAGSTPAALADARALVAPGSVAARYLTSLRDRAPEIEERKVTKVSEGRYRLCAGADCEVLSDLVLADGKISSFKIDGRTVR